MVDGCAVARLRIFWFSVFGFWFLVFGFWFFARIGENDFPQLRHQILCGNDGELHQHRFIAQLGVSDALLASARLVSGVGVLVMSRRLDQATQAASEALLPCH